MHRSMKGMLIERITGMAINRGLLATDGKLLLDKPQFRNKSFHTVVFENYSRVENAVESVILELICSPKIWTVF